MTPPGKTLLCWTDEEPKADWEPSQGNFYWRPQGPRYPNSRQLMPGDIILFHPQRPTLSQRAIRWFQKGVSFTHAALYLSSDYIICEADTDRGVHFSDLETKLRHSCLLVRRVPEIADQDRKRMAMAAAALRGSPYAFRRVFDMVLARYLKIEPMASIDDRFGVICSTLCEHALLEGTKGRVQIRTLSNQVVTPADLVESAALVDVPVEWRRVNC